jgi:hypothetical protein
MKSKKRKQSPPTVRSNILRPEDSALLESTTTEAANLIQDMINTLADMNANAERTFQEMSLLRGNLVQV